MDVFEFKQAVASFVGREPEYFIDNVNGKPGPDKLLIAINNAKGFIQRQIDFEYARVIVDLSYTTTIGAGEGADLGRAVLHDTATPVRVKKVINLYSEAGWPRMLPLRQKLFRSVTDLMRKAADEGNNYWVPSARPGFNQSPPHGYTHTAVAGHGICDPIYYQHGRTIYLYPKPNGYDEQNQNSPAVPALKLIADVVQFMPPYCEFPGNDQVLTDFLLEDCYDYLLYRTATELNVFLKDEDQLQISQSKMTEALENVRQWNADLINAEYDME